MGKKKLLKIVVVLMAAVIFLGIIIGYMPFSAKDKEITINLITSSAINTATQENAATVTRLFPKYASITAVTKPSAAEIP